MSRPPGVMPRRERAPPGAAPPVADSVLGWRFTNPALPPQWTIALGETAELVAAERAVTREAQDDFALRSQRQAAAAIQAGRFRDGIVPVEVPGRKGEARVVDADEHPRPETTDRALAALPPVFKKGGTVTAGNSSGLNDGAAALLVVEAKRAQALGLRPLARVMAGGVVGVEPDRMGLGPVPATRLALERAGVGAEDLDLIELNEAFAAQAIPCLRDLALDPDKVNVNGGAIALGHPVGCSGARIVTTLVHELRRRGGRQGLATMCIGVGQGIAAVIETT